MPPLFKSAQQITETLEALRRENGPEADRLRARVLAEVCAISLWDDRNYCAQLAAVFEDYNARKKSLRDQSKYSSWMPRNPVPPLFTSMQQIKNTFSALSSRKNKPEAGPLRAQVLTEVCVSLSSYAKTLRDITSFAVLLETPKECAQLQWSLSGEICRPLFTQLSDLQVINYALPLYRYDDLIRRIIMGITGKIAAMITTQQEFITVIPQLNNGRQTAYSNPLSDVCLSLAYTNKLNDLCVDLEIAVSAHNAKLRSYVTNTDLETVQNIHKKYQALPPVASNDQSTASQMSTSPPIAPTTPLTHLSQESIVQKKAELV